MSGLIMPLINASHILIAVQHYKNLPFPPSLLSTSNGGERQFPKNFAQMISIFTPRFIEYVKA